MAELFDMKEIEERVILIAVSTDDEDDTRASLDELEELVKTAGGVTVDKIIQNRERIHPGTYLGKGKIDEVRERIWELPAWFAMMSFPRRSCATWKTRWIPRSWIVPWSFWIFSRPVLRQVRVRFRLSWPS